MNCLNLNCNAPVLDGSRYCPICGTPIDPDRPYKTPDPKAPPVIAPPIVTVRPVTMSWRQPQKKKKSLTGPLILFLLAVWGFVVVVWIPQPAPIKTSPTMTPPSRRERVANRSLERRITAEARQMVRDQGQDSDAVRGIVLAGEGWHAAQSFAACKRWGKNDAYIQNLISAYRTVKNAGVSFDDVRNSALDACQERISNSGEMPDCRECIEEILAVVFH